MSENVAVCPECTNPFPVSEKDKQDLLVCPFCYHTFLFKDQKKIPQPMPKGLCLGPSHLFDPVKSKQRAENSISGGQTE
jgi:DNA-directed RNA polymerase subunit RPC12/RpoP